MPYLGNGPATAYTSTTKDTFSGDGSTTDFTLSKAGNNNALRVVVENVVQNPAVAYACTGTTLAFTSAPPTGTNNIYVVHLGPPAASIVPAANTVGGLFKGERGEIGQTNSGGDIFRINEQTLNSDVTIDATENASCTGPLAVASGKTITITTGGNLSIV
tara:strand:- start:415 stop:894 length:480 start_codon:yes stop_codon:yes gene_type:complete